MKLYSLKIGTKEFKVALVTAEGDMKKGLAGSKKLKPGYGMLFDFGSEMDSTMNMGNMNYDIDMMFINNDLKVFRAVKMSKSSKPITTPGTRLVFEVNAGEAKGLLKKDVELCECLKQILNLGAASEKAGPEEKVEKVEEKEVESPGVNIIIQVQSVPEKMKAKFKQGGTIDLIEEDVKAKDGKMQVLDDKGTVLMNLDGGERIFSIDHTNKLVSLAEKVEAGAADEAELGKLMAEIIDTQNTQDPEYV